MSNDDTPKIKMPKCISDRFIDASEMPNYDSLSQRVFNPYCPKCHSRLYPVDDKPMREKGVCSYCVTYSRKDCK